MRKTRFRCSFSTSKNLSTIIPDRYYDAAKSNMSFWNVSKLIAERKLKSQTASIKLMLILRKHYRIWCAFLTIYKQKLCTDQLTFDKAHRLFDLVNTHRIAANDVFLQFTLIFQAEEMHVKLDSRSVQSKVVTLTLAMEFIETMYHNIGNLMVVAMKVLRTMNLNRK
jgi:hypothetical protein